MTTVKKFSLEWGGKNLEIEVGKLAQQALSACTARYGDTVVLATVTQGSEPRDGVDYFPLLVDYEEKLYAAGKIKGSRFIKREGRASDEAILTARLIDRSIRPLFDPNERRDVQVVVTVLSVDGENDPDIPALAAVSCALHLSPLPWRGPIGGVRVGQINGEWVLNPTYNAREKSEFDLVVVSKGKDEVVMIEAGANQVKEDVIVEAISFAQKHSLKLIKWIEDIRSQMGLPEKELTVSLEESEEEKLLKDKIEKFISTINLDDIFPHKSKEDYKQKINSLKGKLEQELKDDNEVSKEMRAKGLVMFDEYLAKLARRYVFSKGKRVDGRAFDEIRPLSAEVGILPRTHGSALFMRGETQVLSVVTLGAPSDEQFLDTMEFEGKKRYMHHYNFPGFSVGEVSPMRGPGRREIGHGALAEKALEPVIPPKEDFPYTIRVVSEVLSSNGSTSQASVCGSSLALMDAGVPIAEAVAGIAIGLLTNPDNPNDYVLLTDIQGIEDHDGDMDFKIAGTKNGITAIQLDIKLDGISLEICRQALERGKQAREQILSVMNKTIDKPREQLSPYAPRIVSFRIDPEKIRDVIGTGGKVINEIIDATGVTIDIESDGLVMVTGTNEENVNKAVEWIKNIVRDVKVGEEFEGKVTRVLDFGAFVEILPGKEGMVHISELDWGRTDKVQDVVKVGDKIRVRVSGIDDMGRINLSRKALLPRPDNFADNNRRSQSNHHHNNRTRHHNSNNKHSHSSKPHNHK